jgi:carbonic anhydrase
MQGTAAPGQITTLYRHFQPALDQAGSNLEAAIKSNAKLQSDLLRKGSTVIAGLVKENKVKVTSAYYDLGGGGVTLLE